MSRNIEDVFGGVAVSSRMTTETYTAKGGETVVTANQDFVNASLVIDGALQSPGEAFYIDGRNFNLAQPLNKGSDVQLILNTAWSPKEVQGQYTQVVQFRSTGGETNYSPGFSFSSVLMFFGDRPWVPGIDYSIQNGKIVYASPLAADKQAYIIFNGGKGDLAFYKKLDEANADKAELLERILNVYPVNWPVASESEMLALDAKPSDTATRSDQSRVYYLTASPASDIDNWKPFIELRSTVVTVNGRVGDVIVAEKGANNDITSLGALSGPLRLGGDAVNQYDAVTLRQLLAAGGGTGANMTGVMTNFLGSVEWFNGSRARLPAGYVASDGQLLSRADNADLWNAVNSGMFISTDDATWQATPTARAQYSTGDGSTTFRVPDLNGVWKHPTNSALNSIPGLFLRGDGFSGSGSEVGTGAGVVRDSAAPDITATLSLGGAIGAVSTNNAIASGSFYPGSINKAGGIAYNTTLASKDLNFRASLSDAAYGRNAATEVRPRSAVGVWLIRVNSKFSAAGTAFNVIAADSVLPAAGTVVYGGDVRSNYQVAGADYMVARMRSRVTVGGAKVGAFEIVDASNSTSIVNGLYVKNDGSVAAVFPYATTASGGQNETILKAIVGGRRAGSEDVDGAFFGLSCRDYVGANIEGRMRLSGLNPSGNTQVASWVFGHDGSISTYGRMANVALTTSGLANQSAPYSTWQITDNGLLDGRVRMRMDIYGRVSSGTRQGVIRVFSDDSSNEKNWIFDQGNGRISGSAGLVALESSSDAILKDVKGELPLEDAAKRIDTMAFVQYYWNNHAFNQQRGVDQEELQRGLIAQQLEEIDPYYVRKTEQTIGDSENGEKEVIRTLNESALLMDALATIQLLRKEMAELKAEVAELKSKS